MNGWPEQDGGMGAMAWVLFALVVAVVVVAIWALLPFSVSL